MQLNQLPDRLTLGFAASGGKNTIPVASQIGIVNGRASFTDGFPPLTRTPLSSGGVPPFGEDMNGILFALSVWLRWISAGGGAPYSSAFATDANVGGHPKGARILRSDGLGYWLNTTENNQTDPEQTGAFTGWVPDDGASGVTAVTGLTNANVTLSPVQWGRKQITFAGVLTANVQIIFPATPGIWLVRNLTSGNFTVTCKTASGTGVVVAQGAAASLIWGDGTNVYSSMADFATLAALFLGNTNNAWNKDAAGADRLFFNSSNGQSVLKGTGATAVALQNAAGQQVGLRSSGTLFGAVDAVAADDFARYGQTSRVGATLSASDYVYLDFANKIIFQWASVNIPGVGGVTWTYPTALAVPPYQLGGNAYGNVPDAVIFAGPGTSSTSVDFSNATYASSAFVFCVGVKA